MKRKRLLYVLVAMGLLATACGRSDSGGGGGGGTPTSAATNAACDGVTLEATDTGVTADTITIQVMADTGSPLAPGLFQGNVDALKGFEKFINDNGGIGCRQLKVEEWDSKLTPEETKNGQLNACSTSLALVGGNSLFNPDVSTMNTCPDAAGAATGVPDIAALANDINEQCAVNAFIIQGIAEKCPADGTPPSGARDLVTFTGVVNYYQTIEPNLVGFYMVPGDLPTTVQSATFQIASQAQQGVDWIGTVKVSGRDEQSAYTPRVQQIRSGNANYVYDGSNDVAMMNMRREAAAQGLDNVKIWACSLACYTDKFKAAVRRRAGHLRLDAVPALRGQGLQPGARQLPGHVGTPDSFGAQAWMAAVLFQDAVNQIVESDGPNAITRAKMLEVLNGITEFDANGWMGPKNPKGGFSDCQVILQMGTNGFERVQPTEKGQLDCNPDYITTVNLDPAVEAQKIQ